MSAPKPLHSDAPTAAPQLAETGEPAQREETAAEIGGREAGLDPTRYGDWEKNGRCIDF